MLDVESYRPPIYEYPGNVTRDDDGRILVYTDGSATGTACRATARAGWGVFYGHGSPLNVAERLKGGVQTSTRAELRALLHVIRTMTQPTRVRCDCKYVVEAANRIIGGDEPLWTWPDVDLWMAFRDLTRSLSDQGVNVGTVLDIA